MAIVEINKDRKMRGKLTDRGMPCMYLGRADNHSNDVYRFLNLKTNRIMLSRDVQWLNKSYGDWKGITNINIREVSKELDDDDDYEWEDQEEIEEADIEDNFQEQVVNDEEDDVEVMQVIVNNNEHNNKKLVNALRKISNPFLNPEAQEHLNQLMENKEGRCKLMRILQMY